MRRLLATLALFAAAAAPAAPAMAQDGPTSTSRDEAAAQPAPAQPAVRQIRGVIQAVDGEMITVAQDGAPNVIALQSETVISVLKPIAVTDIQPGAFIGTANVGRTDGAGTSLEVHVFPPEMRGTGEGHHAVPGQKAMMTNGEVTNVVADAKIQELDIRYAGPDGPVTRHVLVPPGTPVIAISRGDPSMLQPGVAVSVMVASAPGGLVAIGFTLGEGGKPPPL